MTDLNELKSGEYAKILSVDAEKDVKERLRMLGIAPNEKVKMLKKIFFGRECLLQTAFGRVGMRRECAQKIKIARLSDNAASLSERETVNLPSFFFFTAEAKFLEMY